MAAEKIGSVKSSRGKTYEVFWNTGDKQVYVGYEGRTGIGTARSAAEAMRKAEAWLYNK